MKRKPGSQLSECSTKLLKSLRSFGASIARGKIAPADSEHEAVARALVSRGISLAESHRFQPAISTFDQVIQRFGLATEPTLRRQVASALFNKGVALGRLGRPQDELDSYNEL